ncbi:sulfurtransferase TusA family protein [Rodentibacter haemolyticus]|uniref:Sulfurtransferase TusA family protein n=1 Tax=Rodentibacter haemolyticus TaxID=2778911 RepID=A0ABX6UZ98_9PAST|nr:sulfurtransferase TusA family protein [Rodentibacter haemolyticus]QPB43465.1 sulfurtransferase TusA family protein [Rodentibacter haemolyticus]
MDYQLDIRAYRCPLPLLMVKKVLATLKENDELSVFISTENNISDIMQLCETLNFTCRRNGAEKLTIKKSAN